MRTFVISTFVLAIFLGTVSFANAACVIGQVCIFSDGSRGICRQDPESGVIGCGVAQIGAPSPGNTNQDVKLINPLGVGTSLPKLLEKILDFVVNIGAIVIVFMLVYVGYLFVVAQGNSTKIEDARKALLWTVVGALILLGAKAISAGIAATVQSLSSGG